MGENYIDINNRKNEIVQLYSIYLKIVIMVLRDIE